MSSADDGGAGDRGEVKFGGKDFVIEVCRESLRNRCVRPDCRFAHPPPYVQLTDGKVQCCVDFLMGRCFRLDQCRYFHPPPHLAAQLIPTEDPKFSHYSETDASGNVVDTLSSVTHAIMTAKEALDVALAVAPAYGDKKFEKNQTCKDYLNGKCNRSNCRFYHPPGGAGQSGGRRGGGGGGGRGGDGSKDTCKDFLNGVCFRSNCRFYHPPEGMFSDFTSGSNYMDFEGGGGGGGGRKRSSDTCKDFLNGKCFRSKCRFYHPPEMSQASYGGGAMKKGSFSGASGRVGVDYPADTCKDFLNGKCFRSNCRFYHPPEGQSDGQKARKRPYSEALGEDYEVPVKREFEQY